MHLKFRFAKLVGPAEIICSRAGNCNMQIGEVPCRATTCRATEATAATAAGSNSSRQQQQQAATAAHNGRVTLHPPIVAATAEQQQSNSRATSNNFHVKWLQWLHVAPLLETVIL